MNLYHTSKLCCYPLKIFIEPRKISKLAAEYPCIVRKRIISK